MANKSPEKLPFNTKEHFDQIISLIFQTYDPLIDQLKARRDKLLGEVTRIRDEYLIREKERKDALQDSDKMEKQIMDCGIKANLLVKVCEKTRKAFKESLEELKTPTKIQNLLFQCPTVNQLESLIDGLGRIVCVPDYSEKGTPFVATGKKGTNLGEFEEPRSLALDEFNEKVYIADSGNHRVQIFSFEGKFISQFGHQHLKKPFGIAVTEKYIYVTDTSQHILFQFIKKNFQFFNRSGSDGKKVQLRSPQGLAVDATGEIFIADSLNHRIAILFQGLQFLTSIGTGKLQYPRDVKLKEDLVIVLDDGPLCIHFFLRSGEFQRSCLSQGSAVDTTVWGPKFFDLDRTGKLLISDWGHHRIAILSNFDHSLQTIGSRGDYEGQLNYPSGIAVSENGIIFVVSHNKNYILQCF